MSIVLASALWDAVSGLTAVAALLVSVVVWLSQRKRDSKQADIQERLAAIEEGRRQDEVQSRDEAKRNARLADVQVIEFRMERPGGRESDKVSITIENRGPAVARNVDLALLDSEDAARSRHLGEAIELLDELGGYSGTSRKGYFQIGWELGTKRPLEALPANERVTFPFWLGYRAFGTVGIRVDWEDESGPRVARPFVPFKYDPS